MIGIDTNLLVRFLMQDDPSQGAIARGVFSGLTRDEPGFLSSVVMAELTWVLARSFNVPRERIGDTIEALLRTDELVIENKAASFRALTAYRFGKSVGFADALIAEIPSEEGAVETLTFDKMAAAEAGMRLL